MIPLSIQAGLWGLLSGSALLIGAAIGQWYAYVRMVPLLTESNLAVAIATEHCRQAVPVLGVAGADFSRKKP